MGLKSVGYQQINPKQCNVPSTNLRFINLFPCPSSPPCVDFFPPSTIDDFEEREPPSSHPQSSLHPEPAPESGFTVRLSCIEYPLFRESVLGAERTRLKATPSQMIPKGRCDENALSIHLIHCRPTRPPQSRDSRFSPAAIKRYHGSPSSLVQETTGLRFGFFFRFCLCFYILSHLIILSTSSLTLCHT